MNDRDQPKFIRSRVVHGERTIEPVPLRLIACWESGLFMLCASARGVHHILAFPNELFCMN